MKNEGAALVNNLVTSKNTYEFSEGSTVMTDKGPVKIDYITANLPTFGDQTRGGSPIWRQRCCRSLPSTIRK